jgi:hypothetical protein
VVDVVVVDVVVDVVVVVEGNVEVLKMTPVSLSLSLFLLFSKKKIKLEHFGRVGSNTVAYSFSSLRKEGRERDESRWWYLEDVVEVVVLVVVDVVVVVEGDVEVLKMTPVSLSLFLLFSKKKNKLERFGRVGSNTVAYSFSSLRKEGRERDESRWWYLEDVVDVVVVVVVVKGDVGL